MSGLSLERVGKSETLGTVTMTVVLVVAVEVAISAARNRRDGYG